jgi:hypothetical protein
VEVSADGPEGNGDDCAIEEGNPDPKTVAVSTQRLKGVP